MDISIPEWLNKEFVKYALQDNDNSFNIKIKNFKVENAIPKGNNYSADILRVHIDYIKSSSLSAIEEDEEVLNTSIVLKSPKIIGSGNIVITKGLAKKEIDVYKILLPKLKTMFENNEEFFAPKYFPSMVENILVMEDLKTQGYELLDRFELLDFNQSKFVLENIANFHAVSYVLIEKEPELIQQFGEDLVKGRKQHTDKDYFDFIDAIFGKSQLNELAKAVETWPLSKKYADKLFNLSEKVWEIQYELDIISDDNFNTFNHADLWLNNMLFKYSSDRSLEHIKFLDFPLLCYSDTAVDVYFFFGTSVKFEVLEEYFEDLLKIYLESLNKSLRKHGSKITVSENKFRRSMKEKEIFWFLSACRILPYVLAQDDEIVNFEDNDAVNNFGKKYQSKRFKNIFSKYLDYFSNRSWFQNL